MAYSSLDKGVRAKPVKKRRMTYAAAAARALLAGKARVISLIELGGDRLSPGSLGPYDSVVF